MPLEGERRWLEVGEVTRVVILDRRVMKSQDSRGIWSDFSGLPKGLCFGRSEKVVGGRTVLKGSGS